MKKKVLIGGTHRPDWSKSWFSNDYYYTNKDTLICVDFVKSMLKGSVPKNIVIRLSATPFQGSRMARLVAPHYGTVIRAKLSQAVYDLIYPPPEDMSEAGKVHWRHNLARPQYIHPPLVEALMKELYVVPGKRFYWSIEAA